MFGKWWKILILKMIKISLWSTEIQIHLGQRRSSHRSYYIQVGVLKNFVIFTGNHLCWNLFLTKLQACRPATLLIQVLSYPIATGRKLNVRNTFRRPPRRLLNVLCTFNLRPVSTGYKYCGILKTTILMIIQRTTASD